MLCQALMVLSMCVCKSKRKFNLSLHFRITTYLGLTQSQVGKDKEAWFDQTLILIPSEIPMLTEIHPLGHHSPHPNECSASFFLLMVGDDWGDPGDGGVLSLVLSSI
uniref:hypothetical protein n=1 Tax=Jatropha curcas TaxID=180498 RepID=UPI0027A98EEE|nr:hypothetical protein QLP06_mgp050 [Jatropha curcas]WFG81189.1 hypothetical protein [Jatropha curcas]